MKRLLLIGLLLTLAACTTAPQRPPVANPQHVWEQHQAVLSQLTDWSLSGRVAIRTDEDGWQFTIQWQQLQQDYAINLIAPMGQGGVKLNGNDRQVTLLTSEGESASARNPDQLLERMLGWRVPVTALRYWVLGLPAPGDAVLELDDYGRLERLVQGGWTIRFPSYQQVGDLELPTKIFVDNHQASVRLVVGEWVLTPRTSEATGG